MNEIIEDTAPYDVDEKPRFSVTFAVTPTDDGKQTISVSFEPGIYGEARIDKEMDKLSPDEKGCYDTVCYIAGKIMDTLTDDHKDGS